MELTARPTSPKARSSFNASVSSCVRSSTLCSRVLLYSSNFSLLSRSSPINPLIDPRMALRSLARYPISSWLVVSIGASRFPLAINPAEFCSFSKGREIYFRVMIMEVKVMATMTRRVKATMPKMYTRISLLTFSVRRLVGLCQFSFFIRDVSGFDEKFGRLAESTENSFQ